jgi:hypothetical protein
MGEKRPKIQQLLAFDLEGRGGEVDFSSARGVKNLKLRRSWLTFWF